MLQIFQNHGYEFGIIVYKMWSFHKLETKSNMCLEYLSMDQSKVGFFENEREYVVAPLWSMFVV